MALAADDHLILRDPRRAGDDLVGLTGVDEHPADLGDLVGAPAPAEHPRRGAAARTARVVDDRQVAGAEADHRVRRVVHGRHQLADLAVRQRLAGPTWPVARTARATATCVSVLPTPVGTAVQPMRLSASSIS